MDSSLDWPVFHRRGVLLLVFVVGCTSLFRMSMSLFVSFETLVVGLVLRLSSPWCRLGLRGSGGRLPRRGRRTSGVVLGVQGDGDA